MAAHTASRSKSAAGRTSVAAPAKKSGPPSRAMAHHGQAPRSRGYVWVGAAAHVVVTCASAPSAAFHSTAVGRAPSATPPGPNARSKRSATPGDAPASGSACGGGAICTAAAFRPNAKRNPAMACSSGMSPGPP